MRAQFTHRNPEKDVRFIGVCGQCGRLYHGYARHKRGVCSYRCYLASLPPPDVRFWAKVRRAGPDECWLWTAATNGVGYGKFIVRGRLVYAHRFAYALHYGAVPAGLLVCHHCDVRACCNPAHLYAGTAKDNLADTTARDRWNRRGTGFMQGTAHANAKLDEDKVRAIRAAPSAAGVNIALARQYGVSVGQIEKVRSRAAWRHVP